MKVATCSLLALVFSALMFPPTLPKNYPSEESVKKGRVIIYQEQKLKRLIESVEYQIKQDSLEIAYIQNITYDN